MNFFRHLIPLAIAGAGITVAQLHGAPFWVGLFTSWWLGWAVSLTFETGSVWLWWRGDRDWKRWLAKWAATFALVWGMISEAAAAPLANLLKGQFASRILDVLKSQSEAGHWVSQTTIKKLANAVLDGDAALVQGGEVLAGALFIPALYALAILALTTVAREWRPGVSKPRWGEFAGNPAPKPEIRERTGEPGQPPAVSSESAPFLEKAAIFSFAKRRGLGTQKAVANAIGEHPSTLSEFANGKADDEQAARIWGALKG